MNKLFEIECFDLEENQITVFAVKGTASKTITVPRQKFENWLRFDDRLNWEMNCSDYKGEHVQETGVMSMEEYYALPEREIDKDLYDYIVLKMEDSAKIFDETYSSIQSILKNAFSHLEKISA